MPSLLCEPTHAFGVEWVCYDGPTGKHTSVRICLAILRLWWDNTGRKRLTNVGPNDFSSKCWNNTHSTRVQTPVGSDSSFSSSSCGFSLRSANPSLWLLINVHVLVSKLATSKRHQQSARVIDCTSRSRCLDSPPLSSKYAQRHHDDLKIWPKPNPAFPTFCVAYFVSGCVWPARVEVGGWAPKW